MNLIIIIGNVHHHMMKIYFAIVFLIEKIKIALETNKFKLEFIHEHLVNFIW